jgi:hypothetical protein
VRFVLAIVCFALAAISMGLGVAERTILAGPDQASLSSTSKDGAPVVVIDGTALNAYEHTQTVRLAGSTNAFAAYGRTSDVLAWVGNTNYTHVTYDAKTHKLVSKLHRGVATSVPNPKGSDLWLAQYTGSSARSFHLKVPASVSVIAVSNGTSPAPSTVTLTWPINNEVPWSGPIIVAGAILFLVGLALLLWAITHLRRMRGPRRTQARMPKLPRQPRYKPSRKAITARKEREAGKERGAIEERATSRGRKAITRFIAITPALGILLVAGCTATPSPVVSPSVTPTTSIATKAQITAVTPAQLQQIMQRVSSTVAAADNTSNATLLATRMAGPALSDRLANYKIRKVAPKEPASIVIPSGTIRVALPQASNTWPRSVFAVVQNAATPTLAPVALMLVQNDPRANYKVQYAMSLQPGIKLPELPGASVGATRLLPDIGLLKVQPGQLAVDYGSILTEDSASPSFSLFDATGDTFRTQVGAAEKLKQQKALPSTAKLTFGEAQGPGQTIALATFNSGAIVAVDLNESETVRPVKAGADVSTTGAVKALSGKATSTKGIVATYGDQLLFYVPAATTKSGKIELLGYTTSLINAAEYKK